MYGADQHLERVLIVPGLCSIAMRLRESLCRIIPNLSMQAVRRCLHRSREISVGNRGM